MNTFDYTNDVQYIKDKVSIDSQNYTVSDCCGYNYQLLDKFCVSRSHVSRIKLSGCIISVFSFPCSKFSIKLVL